MTYTDFKLMDNEKNKDLDIRIIEKAKFSKTTVTKVAEKHLEKFLPHKDILIEIIGEEKEETIENPKEDIVENEETYNLPINPKKDDLKKYLIEVIGKTEDDLKGLNKTELQKLADEEDIKTD